MELEEDGKRTTTTKSKLLILMKGHPGCGKSTVSRALARILRCPVVDKDDVRDCTLELECPCVLACTCSISRSLEETSGRKFTSHKLNELSYMVMWRVVETQLELGINVILDCPLAREGLFRKSAALARKFDYTLAVVECLPGDKEEWRTRLETRASLGFPASRWDKEDDPPQISTNEEEQPKSTTHIVDSQLQAVVEASEVEPNPRGVMRRWHKPSQWTDIQNLLADYAGCYEYDTSTAKKLILDTTAAPTQSLVEAALQFLTSLKSTTNPVTYYPSRLEENNDLQSHILTPAAGRIIV